MGLSTMTVSRVYQSIDRLMDVLALRTSPGHGMNDTQSGPDIDWSTAVTLSTMEPVWIVEEAAVMRV